jgi:RimJ/RimL family protein N-acetyltransferase
MKIQSYSDEYKNQVIELVFDILENEFGHHSKNGRPDVKNISKFYQKDKNNNFWIAIDENNNIVGTIAIFDLGEGWGNLRRLYVKKEFRKMGLAQDLFSAFLKFAKDKKYNRIFLSTWNEAIAAQKFYKKNGFVKIKSLPERILWTTSKDTIFYELELK